jgi:hypothetical protein
LFGGARFGSIDPRSSPMEDSMPNPMIPRRSVVAGGAALALAGLPRGARAARTRFVTANNNPYISSIRTRSSTSAASPFG